MAHSFYADLYKSHNNKANKPEFFQDLELPKITNEQVEAMDQPITLEELKTVLDSCTDSAPGPDGIQCSLYKKTWRHAGPILLKALI